MIWSLPACGVRKLVVSHNGMQDACQCLSHLSHLQGMAMVELLRQLERRAGAPIWTLFDVIGGTSTGGLLAVCLGLLRLNLDACQEIYTSLGNKVGCRTAVGTSTCDQLGFFAAEL